MGVNTSTRLCSLVIALLLVCSALAAVPAPAAAAPTELTECGIISESGTYVLTESISATEEVCLSIDAPDVTVNGQGHTVGLRGSGTAIDVDTNDVTLTDLRVDGGGTGTAVLGIGTGLTVTDTTVQGFNIGIYVSGDGAEATVLTVRNVDVETAEFGVYTEMGHLIADDVQVIDSRNDDFFVGLGAHGSADLTDVRTAEGTVSGSGQGFVLVPPYLANEEIDYVPSLDGETPQSPVFYLLDVEGVTSGGTFTVTDAPANARLLQVPTTESTEWEPAPDALTTTSSGPTITIDDTFQSVLVSDSPSEDRPDASGSADFEVTSLNVTDETPEYGETVNVTVTVENVGGETGTYVTNFNDGFDSYGSDHVELAPGESATFTYSYTVDSYGDTQLFLRSDHLVTLSVEQ